MKKFVVNLCGFFILALMILFVIDDYAVYTVKKSNIQNHSLKLALENGMSNATIVKTEEQPSSLITVLKGQGEYGFIVYSRSRIYGYYRIEKAAFKINDKQEFHTAVTDPVHVYILTLKPNEPGDVSIEVKAKEVRWQERMIFSLFTFAVCMMAIFYRRLKESKT